MKKTIKEDKSRNVIKEEYITDNTLLEYVLEEAKVIIGIRYIDSQKIKETILLRISLEDYAERESSFLDISEDKSTIATFTRVGEEYQLDRVYETTDHSFVAEDFKDVAYMLKFPNQKLNKQLIKQKNA